MNEGQENYNLGVCYKEIGDYAKAISCCEKSVELAIQSRDKVAEGMAYGNLGDIKKIQGKFNEAIRYYLKQLEITREDEYKSRVHNRLGTAFSELGKYSAAIEYFKKSIEIEFRLGHKNDVGLVSGNLGLVYNSVGKYNEAIVYLQNYLETVKETRDVEGEKNTYLNLATAYSQSGSDELAMECRLKFIILSVRTGDKRGEILYYQELGSCFLKQNSLEEAIGNYKKALFIALKIEDRRSIPLAYEELAYCYYQFGDFNEAIKCREESLKISIDRGNKDLEARENGNLGISYKALAHQHRDVHHDKEKYLTFIKQSESYLKESLRCWDEVFDDLRELQTFKISIVDTFVLIYKQLTSVLIETEQTREALVVSEQSRARVLAETLVSKYKMNRQVLSTVLRAKTLNEEDLKTILPENVCILLCSFTVTNALIYWILSPKPHKALTCIEHNMTASSCTKICTTTQRYIIKVVDLAYQSMKVGKTAQHEQRVECKEPLKELFKLLITPVQQHLTEDEIVIVPEGPLYSVPFAALQDPQTGRFLSEIKRIRLAPSLSTLKLVKDCPAEYHSKTGALVVGNPWVGEVMFRGEKQTVENLLGAKREAEAIGAMLRVRPLIGSCATKDAVIEKLREYPAVIHIAAHGDDISGEILLAPGISAKSKPIPEEEDYILTMKEVQEIGVRAQLVVLSCCHSGRGEIRAEGVVGMSRAFLAAGARAVVASLWSINDQAALQFMTSFYLYLRYGDSASLSLQTAVKELRESRLYSEPQCWAPFFLIGDDVKLPKI
ncbi:hypothetical protein QZH41_000840 [Actinostola sp. cb2023]|nr:hypothetical protein QZH41_000840 [Actinostola sp. cb2023]